MSKRFTSTSAKTALIVALFVMGASLAIALALVTMDQTLEALLVLLVGTQFLLMGSLWFAYRASTRVQGLSRVMSQDMREIKLLETTVVELKKQISSLESKEEFWHDLTRKRIRQKHNNLVLISKKNRDLHELTRKRLREKHNSLYKFVGVKLDNLAKIQRQHVQSTHQQPRFEQSVRPTQNRDLTSLRNALFAVMEQKNK